ncbi:MAG: LytR C-terminal domain-containing protein [Acidimicrobiia bacterium]
MSGALAMVLAAVALVAGFFILRSISDGGEQSLDLPGTGGSGEAPNGDGDDDAADPDATTTTVASATTTTTEPPLVTTGASVIVANANGLGGSAGNMTRTLETGGGFTMVDPTDASSTVGTLDVSVIYFDPAITGSEAVAESVNRVLGGDLQVSPLPGTPPTQDGSMDGAGVLLMLGLDKANKTLEELNPSSGAPAATNPPVAGETTTTAAPTG